MPAGAFDLVVVGDGPAGCAAAISTRQRGLTVAILTRPSLPTLCPGETLHPGVEAILRQLGVWDRILEQGFHRHRGIWIEWDSPRRFNPYGGDEQSEWLGLQVDRQRFKSILIDAAVDSGAVVIPIACSPEPICSDDRVVGATAHGKSIRGRWILDATGRRQWLPVSLALREIVCGPPCRASFGWSAIAESSSDGEPQLIACEGGWDWHAPLDEFRAAWVKLRFVEARSPGDEIADSLKGIDMSWRIARPCAGKGWLLAGDAAVMLDPCSSHGVLRALMSGVLASHLIDAVTREQVPEDSAVAEYDAWVCRQFQHDVRALRALYSNHPLGLSKLFNPA